MVDVVEKPDRDTALLGVEERGEDEPARVRLEAHVVEGEVEGPLCSADERRRLTGDRGRRLAAIRQQRELYRRAV